ncbi:MAG TPA: hypothetical protein VFQ61_05095 [Polyangiaceae bacterium]|nr:hypothetical protein [Polyangiaceae bacterium]
MLATTETQTSPDARFRVEYQSHEIKLAHWIDQPRVIDMVTNTVLLDLWPDVFSSWDGHVRFERAGVIRLELREFHARREKQDAAQESCVVEIDVNARRFSRSGRPLPPPLVAALSVTLSEICSA